MLPIWMGGSRRRSGLVTFCVKHISVGTHTTAVVWCGGGRAWCENAVLRPCLHLHTHPQRTPTYVKFSGALAGALAPNPTPQNSPETALAQPFSAP